jgi:hypothetical protein
VGVLLAHEWGDDLSPQNEAFEAAFKEIVGAVPPSVQIDVYCVVANYAGCRATKDEARGTLLCAPGSDAPIAHWDLGEGSLAWFVFVLMAMLDGIRLGDRSLLPYLDLLDEQPK